MSARTLEAAIRELGIDCSVEAHDRLAVILPSPDSARFEEVAVRRAVNALLAGHGFTHLALEVADADRSPPGVPTEPGASTTERAPLHSD